MSSLCGVYLFSALAIGAPSGRNPSKPTSQKATGPNLEGWIRQVDEAFRQSPGARQVRRSLAATRLGRAANHTFDPLSVRAEFSHLEGESGPLVTTSQQASTWTSGIDYQDRFGLNASFGVRNSTEFVAGFDEALRAASLNARLGLDLGQGGAKGVRLRQRDIQDAAFSAQRAQLEESLLQNRLSAMRLALETYTVRCKLQQLSDSREDIAEVVRKGEIRVQTKTLPYADQLNFMDLKNGFDRRIALLQAEQRRNYESMLQWSDELQTLARSLGGLDLSCSTEDLLEQARSAKASIGAILPRILEEAPTIRAARAAREQSLFDAALGRRSQRPNLSPFVAANAVRTEGSDFVNSGLVGVSGQWNATTGAQQKSLRAKAETLEASTLSLEQAIRSLRSQFATLDASLDAQEQVIPTLASSLEISEKVLEIQRTKRRVGYVDSLSVTNAEVNAIDARLALLDSWATIVDARATTRYYAETVHGAEPAPGDLPSND